MLILYGLTIFVGAALLFVVQPMVGRLVLPLLGGSPAVWNTTMVFYQAVLLGGYAYAHFATRWLGVRRQAALHAVVLLLPLLALPIAIPHGWTPPGCPEPDPMVARVVGRGGRTSVFCCVGNEPAAATLVFGQQPSGRR